MSQLVRIPKVTVHPRYIVLHNEYSGCISSAFPSSHTRKLPENTDHRGLISQKAAIRIKKGIDWLLVLAQDKKYYNIKKGKDYQFKLAFITLTLSALQRHTDNTIKSQLLNQFLIEAKKKWRVVHYLWRAEPQKNGNIHFHILVDKFCPWSEVRDTWNRIQNKLGYVSRYRNEMKRFHASGFRVRKNLLNKWAYKSQLRAYRTGSKNDWNSPNSTDVHSIRLIHNLPAYLAKYCIKNKEGRKIKGKLWGLSTSLSAMKGATDVVDNKYNEELFKLWDNKKVQARYEDYYTIIFVDVSTLQSLECFALVALFLTFVNSYKDQFY